MDFTEMKKKDTASLQTEVDSLKKELFNLRLTAMAGQVKDVSQFRKLRHKIAQCLTLINTKGGVVVGTVAKEEVSAKKGKRK
ncbi:50S ribosomal protein L29 [Candidatus Dependentiae bacterium]|nr:50S ribosomal protein L29 [Candidatus Dependentiae bacterium]